MAGSYSKARRKSGALLGHSRYRAGRRFHYLRPMTEPEPLAENPVAEFHLSLKGHTPRVFVTYALIAVNVSLYGAMVAKGVDPMSPTVDSLLAWGADYAPRTLAGQPYRIFTSTFIHIGALHLAMNMFVLWSAG